ncbi:MAG: hypothetical protein Q8Q31_02245 [Nanoarchaeota archaeon]|nr:hypothetical protein [Nanoarchaeota archaeon]
MKSAKIVYENQEEIKKFIIQESKSKYLEDVKEAYLIGSLTTGNFGRYPEVYEGYFGSDLDVVVVPIKINSNWKYEGESHDWSKIYRVGEITIEKIVHPVKFMIPFNDNIHLLFEKAEELNWKVERLK